MGYSKTQWLCLLLITLINGKLAIGGCQESSVNAEINITILESAVSKGAVCLDGSPPAYYYDKGYGEGANNWIVYLRGGGWCPNVPNCIERAKSDLGSSKYATATKPFYGILSKNKAINPDFHNWNRVSVLYCDGSSFTGDAEKVDPATNLHFRGARIFLSMVEHLLEKGMKNAKNVILTGSSAGGLSTLLHCDRFRAFFPSSTRVKCLADAAFFVNNKINNTYLETAHEGLINLHHSSKVLPSSCTSKMKPSLCLYPQYIQDQIKTPFFLVNSMFDSYQIKWAFPDYPEVFKTKACSATVVQNLLDVTQQFITALPKQINALSRGMFINSCLAHAQIISDQGWNELTMPNNPKTMAQAFGDWFFDRCHIQLIQEHYLPLNCSTYPAVTPICKLNPKIDHGKRLPSYS